MVNRGSSARKNDIQPGGIAFNCAFASVTVRDVFLRFFVRILFIFSMLDPFIP